MCILGNPDKIAPGRADYEADRAACPNYHDGTPRPSWDQLRPIAKESWNRPAENSARALAARDREITNSVFSRVLRRAGDGADVIALGERTRATVARYLAGIDRPGDVRRLVDAGEIAADTAADLLADWVVS